MKVKELIQELSKLNPEEIVYLENVYGICFVETQGVMIDLEERKVYID